MFPPAPVFAAVLAGLLPSVAADRDALIAAARSGDVAELRKRLDAGTSPNARTEYGATPLHFAADRGNLAVVRLLVERKADVNLKDTFYSATPLTWAVMRGHAPVVGALLDSGATGGGGMLLTAARDGDVPLVKVLLEKAKPTPEILTSALRAATKAEVTDLLTKAGAKPPAASKADDVTAYAGTYHNPEVGDVKLIARDGALAVEVEGRRVMTLSRTAGESFKAEGSTMTAAFTRTGGKVTAFALEAEKQPARKFTRVEAKASNDIAKKPLPAATDPIPDVKTPANWPQFRGVGAAGVADGQFPPTTFDVPKGKNVRWKTPIPGLGHSCPVVWGDRVFLTTAVGDPKATLRTGQYGDVDSVKEDGEHEWRVICLDKKTGTILWDRLACRGVPKVKRHLKGTHANATPATDGKHLVVSFGAEGLYCYDHDGNRLWKKDLGKLDSGWFYDPDYQWGFGSSPVVWGGKCFVQCDAGKNSFLAAFALTDGADVWKTPRDEPPTWGSPTVIEGPDRAELVATGTKFARGYDPATGKELWRIGRLSEISVPTPFLASGKIVVCSGYRPAQPIFAVTPGATGDLSPKDGSPLPTGLAWWAKSGGSYLPTPVGYGGHLYVLSNSGLLSCYDMKTGKKVYSERVGGSSYTASPVAADGRIYCVGETDGVRVVKPGPEFELLAVNPVGETCMATPAVADGMLFLRTERHLIALGVPADDKKPDRFSDIDPVAAKVDVPALIRVRTAEDVSRVRKELLAFIWKNDGRLPTSAEVVRAKAELPKSLADSRATCETLTVSMDQGFKSVVHHFIPETPNKKLAIFHQGHDHTWANGGGAETVAFLLKKGYSVMVFQMPLFGDNKRFAPAGFAGHDAMAKLASRELEPIKFFLEPIAVALNYAVKQSAPEDVVMIGLSGGGWTTTLYAAIDPRVRLSFPVAGTLPDYLRVGRPGDRGDWEQFYPDLYKIANYLDLYVMGSSGQGRRQRQVLNKYDTCCFWGVGYRTYEKHVTKAVANLGAGAFDVYLDESHRSHLVSRDALKDAVGPLLDAPRKP